MRLLSYPRGPSISGVEKMRRRAMKPDRGIVRIVVRFIETRLQAA
jgi:hypothetical protein